MARTNLGRVVPLHKGDYSATIEYELNDIVSYNGSIYWHFTHEKTTGILPTETSVWKLVIDVADVEQYIARAETAALQAEGYADDAQSAKTDAETAKADAETAEQGAVSAKQDALASEENARSYMTAAQTAKGQAESARDLAIQANTDAVDAKQGAESAKDTAVSAKNTAVDAKNTAVSAKTDALAAQDAAESARDLAEGYKDTAVSAKDTAVSAKTAAETAKADAETAKTAAQTAEGNASASATNAEESAEDAEAWAVGKRNGVDVPSTDPAHHNNAKYYAMLAANMPTSSPTSLSPSLRSKQSLTKSTRTMNTLSSMSLLSAHPCISARFIWIPRSIRFSTLCPGDTPRVLMKHRNFSLCVSSTQKVLQRNLRSTIFRTKLTNSVALRKSKTGSNSETSLKAESPPAISLPGIRLMSTGLSP